jgi:hypothetical protein
MSRSVLGLAVAISAGCASSDGDVDGESQAHTTSMPGATAWVRMNGGPGEQSWSTVEAPSSNLTWVGVMNGPRLEIAAYDALGAVVERFDHGGDSFQGFHGLAVGNEERRTMIRIGEQPDGLGCVPEGEGWSIEIVQVERDGTCRWLHTFPWNDFFGYPGFLVEAGQDGTVVVAGYTRTLLSFGSTVVGEDLSTNPDPKTLAAFVLRLDADGEVVWHVPLGHARVHELAVDGRDAVAVALRPSGDYTIPQVVQILPDGSPGWTFPIGDGSPVYPMGLAGSPTGDFVVAGTYFGELVLANETVALQDSGAHEDIFILRLAAADGALIGARRLSGGALFTVGGVAVDHHGKVAIAGSFYHGSLVIGANRFTATTARGFVAEFTASLNTTMFARAYGSSDEQALVELYDVAFSPTSRVMAGGHGGDRQRQTRHETSLSA